MPLEEVLTHIRPFGPIDQVRIEDLHDAIDVLDVHEPLSSAASGRYSLIYGRKGCGKSAAISLFRGLHFAKKRLNASGAPLSPELGQDNITIHIDTWRQFLDMTTSVHRQLLDRLQLMSARNIDYEIIPSESWEDEWMNQLWDQIFRHIYDLCQNQIIPEDDEIMLQNVLLCFDDEAMARMRGTPEYIASNLFKSAKVDVLNYLSKKRKSILILFDSLENYPITKDAFGASMSGFLRAINAATSAHPRIKVIFTLPEELIGHFRGYSENILKDFERSHRIAWRNRDLWRMAAHRYRLFLKIHAPEYYEREISKLHPLSDHVILNDFYDRLFPEYVTNELGQREPARAYILRHTHLLPRHLLLLLNEIAALSFEETKSWERFTESSIVRGVRKRETEIATQVLQPYRSLYKNLERELLNAFSDAPPIFSYGTLQRQVSRISETIMDHHFDLIHFLYSVGIIGRVSGADSSGRYTMADFSYSIEGKINFAGSDQCCLHPNFSRYFDASRHRNGDERVIYPRGIPFDI